MQLDNIESSLAAALLPGWSLDGRAQHTLTVKAVYNYGLDGKTEPVSEAPPLAFTDEYRDDPDSSSLTVAAETPPFKDGFELLVQGQAEVRTGSSGQWLGVALQRNGQTYWEKRLALLGERRWKRSLGGLAPSEPNLKGDVIDICWEHAFGGMEENGKRFDPNPAGMGWAARPGKNAANRPLPYLDRPPFITTVRDRPDPAGFGPIAQHWEPRFAAFQTLDTDQAAEGGSPHGDQTPSWLYNCAPEDQRLKAPPEEGDALWLSGWYRSASDLGIKLPRPTFQVWQVPALGKPTRIHPSWDTLSVDTTQQTLTLLYRAVLYHDETPAEARICLRLADKPGSEADV